MRRICKIKHDCRMWFRAPAVCELGRKINGAVEMQGAVRIDVDVEGLEVGGGVDDADIPGLDEVVGHDNMFLVRGHFDVVGS